MTIYDNRTERLHGLDSLRAIMMLLGLVLHSAITYGTIPYGEAWPLKDPDTTNIMFDLSVVYIHTFRMPVFFIIAGFFGALLFYERSPRKMLNNRIKRIVFSFIVFVILLWPFVVFAIVFSTAAFAGEAAPLAKALAVFNSPLILIPGDTMHLWFLYYLIYFSFAGWLFGRFQIKFSGVSDKMQKAYQFMMRSSLLRPLIFAAITFVGLRIAGLSWMEKTGGFIPALKPIILYFIFYLFGWLLYGSKHLLNGLNRRAWLIFAAANFMFLVKIVLSQTAGITIMAAVNSLTTWLFIFSIMGLFLRYFNRHSKSMRYISDSSYWIYLLHLPFTAFFPAFLVGTGLPVIVKFLLVTGITTIICVVSYGFFIRGSFVGKFLNGRKYPVIQKQHSLTCDV